MKNTRFLISFCLFLVLVLSCKKEKPIEKPIPIKVTEITLNHTSLIKNIGDTEKLIATIKPDNATDKSTQWESSNSDIVSVDNQGIVTALKAGTATITAVSDGKTAKCVIKVIIKVTEITLNHTSLIKNIGDTEKLIVTIKPDNATDKSIQWKSSNSEIVSVDNQGMITALKAGTATITAVSGEKTAECIVNATPKGMTIENGILTKMRNEDIPSDGHITIPNFVTKIDKNAFANNEKLTSITIPNSVKSVGRSAFDGCKNLTSITFGASIEIIEVYAFEGCDKLTSVTLLSKTPPALKGYIRGDFDSMQIKVPAEAVSAYKENKDWKKYHSRISVI